MGLKCVIYQGYFGHENTWSQSSQLDSTNSVNIRGQGICIKSLGGKMLLITKITGKRIINLKKL